MTGDDADELLRVVEGWPTRQRPDVEDPRQRLVAFSDAARVAGEVRVWEAARTSPRMGPRTATATGTWISQQAGWLTSVSQFSHSGMGRRIQAEGGIVLTGERGGWIDPEEGMTAELAAELVEVLRGMGYEARALSPREWMAQSADPDTVRSRCRSGRIALRSGLLAPEDRALAREIRREGAPMAPANVAGANPQGTQPVDLLEVGQCPGDLGRLGTIEPLIVCLLRAMSRGREGWRHRAATG